MIETKEELIQEYVDTDNRAGRSIPVSGKETGPSVPKTPANATIKFFRRRASVLIAILLIVVISSLAWFYYSRNSIDRQTTAALDEAYTGGRLLESRITGLKYAPFSTTRSEKEGQNSETLLITERDLLDAVTKDRSGGNLHALGRFYLAKKKFDEAIGRLENAKALAPENAEIFNDLGVAYLEKSQTASSDERNPAHLLEALEYFDKAAALNPRLLPAYFNRANCLELTNLPEQAKEAWQKYLELDPDSEWSSDARKHIDSLYSFTPAAITSDPEQDFLNAFRSNNNTAAFQLAAQNRELIRVKYLPQLLAMSFVNAEPAKRSEKLAAFKYLGKLEKERIGDNFASDLAAFYTGLPDEKITLLREAQDSIKKGYDYCMGNDFDSALNQFENAKKLFLQAGDLIEAHTISDYFIAYCFYVKIDRVKATEVLRRVGDFSEKKDYKWFSLMNYYWILGGQESLGIKTITESIQYYETGLKRAREMDDTYMIQKFLVSLVLKYDFLRQEKKTLVYVGELLEFSNRNNISERQKYRNFDQIIQVMLKTRFMSFARAVALESVSLSEIVKMDPLFAMTAEINDAIVFSRIGELDEAEKRLISTRDRAATFRKPAKDGDILRIVSNLGDLERKRKNYRQAIGYYDECLRLLEGIDAQGTNKSKTGFDRYEVRKSRLLTFQAMGDDQAVEQEIPETIRLAEEYRDEILDEPERLSFFDNQQVVYDTAIEHEIKAGRIEKAYGYAEISNSRSLSDWLAKGARVHVEGQQTKILFQDSAKPLQLEQIRDAMPPNVQIVQYRMLEDRIVIWLISKENFRLFTSPIKSGELKENIGNYIALIRQKGEGDPTKLDEISREMYRLLIEPIRPYLDPGKEICLIPNKELFYVPFSSLISAEGKYLLEEFTLFYSPGADFFIRSTANAESKRAVGEEKLLSLGNPAFDREMFPSLDNLPDAEVEARAVAKNYSPALVLPGKEATKRAFLTAYKDYDVIHFAGHYIVEPDSPLLSKLVMSKGDGEDGSVTNIDLLSGGLPKTKLVILSACQTGVEGYYGGEGLVGLSRTFLALGAPLVVASAWKVDSPATNPLMQNFHRYRKQEGMSTVRALRAAQLDMMHGANIDYRPAYYWAAFAAFGGYAEF